MMRLIILSASVVCLLLWGGPAGAADAEKLYQWYCAQCHGKGGKGDGINSTKELPVQPKNHTDAKEMKKLSDKDLLDSIKKGGAGVSKSELMPPWGGTLTDQEINDLVKHLRKLCKC